MSSSILYAGTAVVDITPPLEVGLLTSSVNGLYEPFESIRLPLKARILVLRSAGEPIAIVSLDLLSLTDTAVGGWDRFKKQLSGTVVPERIIVCYTHTHSAPESGAITDLYLTASFQCWLTRIQLAIKSAIEEALHAGKPCGASLSSAILDGYSLQRRVKTAAGIVMSDSIQPIAPDLFNRQPVDRRIRALHFINGQQHGIATLVHAVCHPVHEMCLPHVSSEFPGEMCRALELSPEPGMPLFLNGAAGDTNPPTVSMGPVFAQKHGIAIADKVKRKEKNFALNESPFAFAREQIQLLIRPGTNVINTMDALARLGAIRIGSLAIVFLPGEPFTEMAFEIEQASPFEHTIIVGFSENNIGYVPTEAAFIEGGYETGPGKWSFLETGACTLIKDSAIRLLEKLYQQ